MFEGDVLFYKKTDFFISKVIAFLTKSDYTHVAIIINYNEETNIVTVVESNRFTKTKISQIFLDDNYVIYTIPNKTKEMQDKILKFADLSLGKKYDYLQVLGLFFSLLFKKGRNEYFNNKNKYICSELIDLAYYQAGVPRKNQLNIGNVTPFELIDLYGLQEYKVKKEV